MQRSSSFLITCGLAVSLAVVLWLWQRDDAPADTNASAVPSQGDGHGRGGGADRGAMDARHEDGRSRSAPPPRAGAGPVAPSPPVQPDELPEAVQKARVEAFRGWHDNAQRQLMTCLPAWTEAGQPRAVRVFFRPQEQGSADDEEPSHLRAETVEPLEPDVEVPTKVRECLDQLLGTELELPQEAPESQHGHQEIIHVMWG